MNAFHYITIFLVCVLHLAAWVDIEKKQRFGRTGLVTIGSFVLFVTLIILSAIWQ